MHNTLETLVCTHCGGALTQEYRGGEASFVCTMCSTPADTLLQDNFKS